MDQVGGGSGGGLWPGWYQTLSGQFVRGSIADGPQSSVGACWD